MQATVPAPAHHVRLDKPETPQGASDTPARQAAEPELNRGGQGVVTRGKWGETPCAIKTVHLSHAAAAGVEIATALRINQAPHAHIVAAYGYSRPTSDSPGKLYLELAQFDLLHACYLGRSLRFVDAHPVREWMLQLAHALCHLHSLGIAHRDVKPENVLLKRMDRDAFEAMASEEMARFGQAAGRRRTGTSSSLPRQGTNLSDSREHTSASFSSAGGAAGQGGSMEFDGDTSAQLVAAGEVTGISANDIPVPRSLLQSSSGNQSPAHRSPVAQGGGTTESRGRLTLAQSVIPEDGQCALPPIDASPTVSRGSSALTPVHRRHERSVSGHLSRARTATSNGVGAHGHPVVGARSSSVVSASGTVEMDDSEGMFPRLVPSTPMLGMPPGSVGQRNASEGQFSMSSNATAAAAAASTPKRQNTAGGRLDASSALPPSGFNRQIHAGQAVPITLPAPRSSWAQVDAEMSSAELTYSKRFKGPNSTNPEVSNVGLVPLLTKCAGGDRGSVLALRSLTAKLCDFGCAIHAPAPGQIPVGKSGKGSTSYCAPEVAIVYLQGKSRPIFDKLWPQSEAIFAEMYRGYDSCLADVWSFGVTLFVTGSGRLPFRVASVDSSTFRAFISTTQPHVVGDEITAPYTAGWPSAHLHDSGASWSWPRGFSPALIHLLRGCLAVRPSERFTMEQVKSHPWFGNPMWIPTDSDTQHLNNATSGSVPISNLT